LVREQRRLAAIVAADVVGYSRLMGRDESETLTRLRKNRTERLDPVIKKYGGRLVKLTGDGALVEFASAVDALSAAIEFQQAMADANGDEPADAALEFRIGLHLGDLIVDGDDLYGDGVNIAARLEGEAPAGGIVISRTVHEAVMGRVRATFDDLGSLILKNIERPVRALSVKWEPSEWQLPVTSEMTIGAATASHTPLSLPDKPSIAVMPFQNMSGDPEQEYFVDGLVEDIITALSRFRSLFVIARNSSFTYKGKAVDIKQVGRDLGVRYVLEGSVRKAGTRVRISGQLIQADTGAHIWADRYDGGLDDMFVLQDRVTLDVVGAIAPSLEKAEIERSKRKPTENHSAYDCYLRGLALGYLSPDHLIDAQKWCYRAIELDSDYAAAHALAALLHSRRKGNGIALSAAEVHEAVRLARRAVELDSDDAVVLSSAAWVLAFVAFDLISGVGLCNRALTLNPNFAQGWGMSGWIQTWVGSPTIAIDHFARSMRLSPMDSISHFRKAGCAHANMMAGNYAEARLLGKSAVEEKPVAANYRVAAACSALAGELDEARTFARLLLEVDPLRRVSNLREVLGPYQRKEDIGRYQEGLRLAGLPE
jgi:TolB-like protein/class 3 adenylate cyclase